MTNIEIAILVGAEKLKQGTKLLVANANNVSPPYRGNIVIVESIKQTHTSGNSLYRNGISVRLMGVSGAPLVKGSPEHFVRVILDDESK